MREIWFGLLIALTLAGSAPARAQAPTPPVDAATAAGLLAIGKDDRVLGQPAAPITIIEYASLSCPHCAHFENEVLPDIQKQWIDTGKVKLVLRDFPLDREALAAETLARCLPPDRYYPLIRAMFADQPQWVPAPDWRAALQRIAKFAGIGGDQFDACLANKAIENQVAASRLVASQQLGVDATPTFFINGKKFEGEPTVAGFTAALAALAPSTPAAPASPPAAVAQAQPAAPPPSPTPAPASPAPAAPETSTGGAAPAPTPLGYAVIVVIGLAIIGGVLWALRGRSRGPRA